MLCIPLHLLWAYIYAIGARTVLYSVILISTLSDKHSYTLTYSSSFYYGVNTLPLNECMGHNPFNVDFAI